MRIYKNPWFVKFAHKEEIGDDALCDAVNLAEQGLIDAVRGNGLLKQRVARAGEGKSGGYRTSIFFRSGERAISAFGFAKSGKANLNAKELAEFRKVAKRFLAFPQHQLDALVKIGQLTEVPHGDEDL